MLKIVYTTLDNNNSDLKTRIYSDCWASYRQEIFAEYGYTLNRVNHSLWFGIGNFHTNTIEGLWSTLKRILNNFAGLSFKLIDALEKDEIEITDYINDWLCYGLFQRECERKKLINEKKKKSIIRFS